MPTIYFWRKKYFVPNILSKLDWFKNKFLDFDTRPYTSFANSPKIDWTQAQIQGPLVTDTEIFSLCSRLTTVRLKVLLFEGGTTCVISFSVWEIRFCLSRDDRCLYSMACFWSVDYKIFVSLVAIGWLILPADMTVPHIQTD